MADRGDYLAANLIEKNISMATDYISKGITMGHMARLSIQVVCDNTDVVGTISFECSNNDENWLTLAYIDEGTNDKSESYPVQVANGFNKIWDWNNLGIGYVRVKFTHSAGSTGTMSIWAIRKRV
jgi:hypothetical protein